MFFTLQCAIELYHTYYVTIGVHNTYFSTIRLLNLSYKKSTIVRETQ